MHASNGGGDDDDDDDDDDYWVTTADWKTVWLKEVAIYVIIALGCQRGEGLMHSFKHVEWGHKRVHTLCVRQVLAIPLDEKCICLFHQLRSWNKFWITSLQFFFTVQL